MRTQEINISKAENLNLFAVLDVTFANGQMVELELTSTAFRDLLNDVLMAANSLHLEKSTKANLKALIEVLGYDQFHQD